ncbi:MAG: hypothetical protein HQK60_16780 [Deltaproteobacteria bacterium]|nr:hypothetical protein [Deltaproteobacteria bacterium]
MKKLAEQNSAYTRAVTSASEDMDSQVKEMVNFIDDLSDLMDDVLKRLGTLSSTQQRDQPDFSPSSMTIRTGRWAGYPDQGPSQPEDVEGTTEALMSLNEADFAKD